MIDLSSEVKMEHIYTHNDKIFIVWNYRNFQALSLLYSHSCFSETHTQETNDREFSFNVDW